MKKYHYLSLIILLILSGYYVYRQYTQHQNWAYFFEDSKRNIFDVLSISDALFHYEFYTKLSAPFSTKDIVKYSPCLVQDEILKLNKKHHLVPQNKLENTFNTQCQKYAYISNDTSYYRFGFWLCHSKEDCQYILLQLDDFLILENKRVVQIKDSQLIEHNYQDFFKNVLKIDNPQNIVLLQLSQAGLGNLLFQYYAADIYAKKHKKQLIVLNERRIHNIFQNIKKPEKILNSFHTIHAPFNFMNRTIDMNADYLLLNGNPINATLFSDEEAYIQNQTVFSHPLSEKNQHIADKMQQENSVAIHVRRGDFKIAGIDMLKMSYYDKAIQYMNSHLSNPHFYIFSDDIQWCKENFKLSDPHTFVDWNTKDYEDLHLMTQSKHNIIANSSFSWWGSFLNKNPKKIVIVPKTGFYSNENIFYNEDIISFAGCVPIDN